MDNGNPVDGEQGHGSPHVTKAFPAPHLGQLAKVVVALDDKADFVHSISFIFSTTSNAKCINDADVVLGLLKQSYGIEAEVIDDPPEKQSKWITKDGLVVRWQPSCGYGYNWYAVIYEEDG